MAKRSRRSKKRTRQHLVDIFIPVYGQLNLLKDCLAALPKAFNDVPFRVFLWDNFSLEALYLDWYQITDDDWKNARIKDFKKDLKELVSVFDFPVKVFYSDQNVGFARANNQLFTRFGSSPLTLFLNSDVILDENSGEHFIRSLDDPQIGIVGAKLRFAEYEQYLLAGLENFDPASSGKVQHVGLSFNISGDPHHLFIGWDVDHPKVAAVKYVPAVTGACLIIRSKLFRQAGMFFEPYVSTYEDVDICFSIRELGYNVVVDQFATGVHYAGASAMASKRGFPMLQRNKLIFYDRWNVKNQITWTDPVFL